MEIDEKRQGLRFLKKCTITDEITSQIRIYPDKEKSADGEVRIHIENIRFPSENIRIGVKAIYEFTTKETVAEKYN